MPKITASILFFIEYNVHFLQNKADFNTLNVCLEQSVILYFMWEKERRA